MPQLPRTAPALLSFPEVEKNDQESFLTSHSDGPQGGAPWMAAPKKPIEHSCQGTGVH